MKARRLSTNSALYDFCGISGSAVKFDLFKVDLIDAEDWSEPLRQHIQGEGVEL